MRERRNILDFNSAGKLLVRECHSCGVAIRRDMGFCTVCGSAQAGARPRLNRRMRPGIWRRAVAEIIDRLVPMPFLVYLFPSWIWVVVANHLLCDGSPSGQSVGKWVCRLCVVSTTSGEPCGVWRAVVRRLLTTLGQAAYCVWTMIPLVIVYELASLAFVLLNPTGRRIEDYLSGTQVITCKAYGKLHRWCEVCGEQLFVSARYCSQCGQPSKMCDAKF